MKFCTLIFLLLVCACTPRKRLLRIKGSDTEVNLVSMLAEQYHARDRDMFVSISGGGSGLGIASLINGQADIANSSRELNDQELEFFRDRNISLDTFIFAEDAIAFVVAATNPIDSMSTAVLADIFSGRITNWKNLSGEDAPITIYGRQSNSGTYDFVMHKLGIRFSTDAKEMNGNAQILEAIKADPSGIGYVGAGYVTQPQQGKAPEIKVLAIAAPGEKANSPLDSNAVFEHRYFFRRHLYQYIRSNALETARPFTDFERSPEGAALIRKAGYYPVKDIQ